MNYKSGKKQNNFKNVFILIILFAFLYLYHYFKLKNYWKFRGIPGPPTTFILGNLHEHLNTKRVNVLQLQEWTKKYGKIYGILEGERKMLVSTDLDFLQEIFVKKSHIFHGRRVSF
uniref:Cytochrome P450 n=1 Tax=Panagrolaimus superbus TaxID=310955 RepID=A0A914YPW3_9BILA